MSVRDGQPPGEAEQDDSQRVLAQALAWLEVMADWPNGGENSGHAKVLLAERTGLFVQPIKFVPVVDPQPGGPPAVAAPESGRAPLFALLDAACIDALEAPLDDVLTRPRGDMTSDLYQDIATEARALVSDLAAADDREAELSAQLIREYGVEADLEAALAAAEQARDDWDEECQRLSTAHREIKDRLRAERDRAAQALSEAREALRNIAHTDDAAHARQLAGLALAAVGGAHQPGEEQA